MADHRHRQGKAPIYSSQAPGQSIIPKVSYSSYYPGTTTACPTTQVVQTRSCKDYSRREESKHQHWEHSVAVGPSALTEKHQIKKIEKHGNEKYLHEKHGIEKYRIEKHVIEKYRNEKHVIEKHVIEKYQNEKDVIEKYRIESDTKHAHRHRIKEEAAVASGRHAVREYHEKKEAAVASGRHAVREYHEKKEVAVASGRHAVREYHEKKKAHKPKEATCGKKHGHHLF